MVKSAVSSAMTIPVKQQPQCSVLSTLLSSGYRHDDLASMIFRSIGKQRQRAKC